ncbi:hypothetical protein AB0F17_56070 [Nonomuraea sp. NPDC026600]|uniref:hypothetical protein n=1 Tax=Nonomuraea sp. NPDC026600 TaxID=3155363 RepID=UPI0033C52183
MIHTVLRRRATGEPVEKIRKDLIIPTGKRKGHNPSLASVYRALAEHEKTQRHPEAVEQAHFEYAALRQDLCPEAGPPASGPETSSTTPGSTAADLMRKS